MIVEGMKRVAGRAHERQPDRRAAIRRAISQAGAGDVVLIAGKGHEDYQILPDGRGGTVKRHFDDREVARAALRERGIAVRASAPSRPTEDDESVIG
jgi:UDP-N-acetylmuramoyl-L-alanyl-D-glutamate--2,6-diaminopimelate ligase